MSNLSATATSAAPLPPPAQPTSSSQQQQDSELDLPPSLASQLELWTNLTFQSDEPLPPAPPPPSHHFDLDGFLNQFGGQPVFPTGMTAGFPGSAFPGLAFPEAPAWPAPAFNGLNSAASSDNGLEERPVKRQRGRKSSVSQSLNEDGMTAAEASLMAKYESGVPLTPAEDKRRRNTAASARFRLKKKEREAQMERNMKHLESRVVELEREAEGLRKENGWLRGLLVGVNVPAGVAAAGVGREQALKVDA